MWRLGCSLAAVGGPQAGSSRGSTVEDHCFEKELRAHLNNPLSEDSGSIYGWKKD